MKSLLITVVLCFLGIAAQAQGLALSTPANPEPGASLVPSQLTDTMTLTGYEMQTEQQPELDRHGKPKLDHHGNPKMRSITAPKAVTRTREAHMAKVFDVSTFTYLQRTDYNYQYNYVSPACLNTWWCHLLAGDPSAQAVAQPVYGQYTMFTLVDADSGDIYIGRKAGSYLLNFAINSTAKYALDSGNLAVVDNRGYVQQIEIVQKILKPAAQQGSRFIPDQRADREMMK